MANATEKEDLEESSPLIPRCQDPIPAAAEAKAEIPAIAVSAEPKKVGWAVEGMPVTHESVVGEPASRSAWDSGLFSCLGRNDEFCSSDLEVCLLGSFAPCVLHGTNVERMMGPGTFENQCLGYTGLYLLGNFCLGWNGLAPLLSFRNRTAIRRRFNLEGNFEKHFRSCGCCGGILEDEEQRGKCESGCDLITHFFCHVCALCQEGRELRRRLPHPGFNGHAVMVMLPPMEQTMARGI